MTPARCSPPRTSRPTAGPATMWRGTAGAARPVAYDPVAGRFVERVVEPALTGPVTCPTRGGGAIACVPAFEAYAALCRR